MNENKCIDCGENIPQVNKRRCIICEGKPEKKKHLSNSDISVKFGKSKETIKRNFQKVINSIDKELSNLSLLRNKFLINEFNEKILDEKLSSLVEFKTKPIKFPQEILIEENKSESNIKNLIKNLKI